MRTVNLAKGNFRFAPVMYLEAALRHIVNMPQSTFDENKVDKEDYLLAMERSPIKDVEIKILLKNALRPIKFDGKKELNLPTGLVYTKGKI